MFNLENNLKSKKNFGKIMFYSILIILIISDIPVMKSLIPDIMKSLIPDIMKPFISVIRGVLKITRSLIFSYLITDFFIVGFEKFGKRIRIDLGLKKIICFDIVMFMVFLVLKCEKIAFSYAFFLFILVAFLMPYIAGINLRKISNLKVDPERKKMLFGYIIYTTILVIIKFSLNKLGFSINSIINIKISYIEYQIIVCTVYLDRLKNMYSLTLISGMKEHIEKFEQIVEKNKHNPKLNYDNNKKLIEEWKKYLEEDNSELENTIEKLSGINKEFFKDEKRKLDERIDRFTGNKKQKKELKSIKKRKINENEILVLEFVLYKTDIEEIIGETDD